MNTIAPALLVGIIGLALCNMLTFVMLIYEHRRAEKLQNIIDDSLEK